MVPATKKLQLTLLSGKRKRLFISLLLLIYLIYPKIKAKCYGVGCVPSLYSQDIA